MLATVCHSKWLQCQRPAQPCPVPLEAWWALWDGLWSQSTDPGQQLVWISVAVIKTAWLVLSIHGSQPALCSFSGCPPCTARHLLVLQSKSWLCRGNGVWTSAFLTDKLPRDQSWSHSQPPCQWGVGCGGTEPPSCSLSPPSSSKAVSRQPRQGKESLSPAEVCWCHTYLT